MTTQATPLIDFSVAIRAYNAAPRLPRLLDSLQAQQVSSTHRWEIVVIDNHSTDSTATVVRRYQARWQPPGGLHYWFEPAQGAAIARWRAMVEARGEWVGFLDDDTWASPTWVQEALALGRHHPQAGAFSGLILGDFEQPPPPHFEQIASYLAVIDRGPKGFSYSDRGDGVLPPGAGLVLRRAAWCQSVASPGLISGPVGPDLGLKGEDLELLIRLQRQGWAILYTPSLVIHHHIPAGRLTPDYLKALGYRIGLAQHHLRMERRPPWQRPAYTLAYALHDNLKALHYYYIHRTTLGTDPVTTCQMAKLWGNVLSPGYIAWLSWQRWRTPGAGADRPI